MPRRTADTRASCQRTDRPLPAEQGSHSPRSREARPLNRPPPARASRVPTLRRVRFVSSKPRRTIRIVARGVARGVRLRVDVRSCANPAVAVTLRRRKRRAIAVGSQKSHVDFVIVDEGFAEPVFNLGSAPSRPRHRIESGQFPELASCLRSARGCALRKAQHTGEPGGRVGCRRRMLRGRAAFGHEFFLSRERTTTTSPPSPPHPPRDIVQCPDPDATSDGLKASMRHRGGRAGSSSSAPW